jgi:hypothetical protein
VDGRVTPADRARREDAGVTTTEELSFTCPRCGSAATGTYYGPCRPCRDALRAAFAGEAREVESEAYEPKMNVTPNAVALKD